MDCGQLYNVVEQINRIYALEIDLDCTAEIYGEHIIEAIAGNPEEFREKIDWLLAQGFGDTVSDICNRFGILLTYDNETFFSQFEKLMKKLGDDFALQISMDMSLLETLL